jgi:ELWxxDGT repeat protein
MALGGQTLFFYSSGLWRTDGTEAGTVLIRDGIAAPDFGTRGALFHGKVLFLAKDRQTGVVDLWQSDGTAAGTDLLVPAAASPRPAEPSAPVVFRDALYFFDREFESQPLPALWRSDGTAAGTRPFELPPAANGEPLRLSGPLVPLGDQLFFVANDGLHGWELWKTDGTAAGTALVSDVAPGPAPSRPMGLAVAGSKLYFSATDGDHGRELWESDGTAAGTRQAADVLPGPASSRPRDLVAADGNLFFTAADGEHGRELWVLPLDRP